MVAGMQHPELRTAARGSVGFDDWAHIRARIGGLNGPMTTYRSRAAARIHNQQKQMGSKCVAWPTAQLARTHSAASMACQRLHRGPRRQNFKMKWGEIGAPHLQKGARDGVWQHSPGGLANTGF
jgi:hypothetical protein